MPTTTTAAELVLEHLAMARMALVVGDDAHRRVRMWQARALAELDAPRLLETVIHEENSQKNL